MKRFILAPLEFIADNQRTGFLGSLFLTRLVVIVLIIGGIFLAQQVLALTVSPVKFEISGEPGQKLLGEIILYSGEGEAKTLYSSSKNFEARGEGGTPHFIPGIEGLAGWITTSEQVVLEPREWKTIPFSIQIPKDAAPGGHFAAILWGTAPPQPQEGGQIVIGAKVGTLVLLRVAGEIEERGALLEFSTKDKQKFFESLPITFVYRFQNEGNDRVRPEGKIRIQNVLGFTTAVLAANPREGNVLPGSIRKFEVKWGEALEDENAMGFFAAVKHQWQNFAFGMYTAKLNLFWEDRTAEASWRFFIIPWQLLSVVIVILAAIGFLGVIGIKRYNQWIVAKSMIKNNKEKEKRLEKDRKPLSLEKSNLKKKKGRRKKKSVRSKKTMVTATSMDKKEISTPLDKKKKKKKRRRRKKKSVKKKSARKKLAR